MTSEGGLGKKVKPLLSVNDVTVSRFSPSNISVSCNEIVFQRLWENVTEKIEGKLAEGKWLLVQISYRFSLPEMQRRMKRRLLAACKPDKQSLHRATEELCT